MQITRRNPSTSKMITREVPATLAQVALWQEGTAVAPKQWMKLSGFKEETAPQHMVDDDPEEDAA